MNKLSRSLYKTCVLLFREMTRTNSSNKPYLARDNMEIPVLFRRRFPCSIRHRLHTDQPVEEAIFGTLAYLLDLNYK
jgi:hypothetical protein